jgi:hypothetical protein
VSKRKPLDPSPRPIALRRPIHNCVEPSNQHVHWQLRVTRGDRHHAATGLEGTDRRMAARRRIRHFTHHTYSPAALSTIIITPLSATRIRPVLLADVCPVPRAGRRSAV